MSRVATVASASKSAQAYRRLRELIDEGRFNAGERLTETKLARHLGMSRGPVRESLLRLQSEGLLKSRGNRRSRVVVEITEDQSPEELLSRYELREQIEGGAARLAAKNMNGWQIDHLTALARDVSRYAKSGDAEKRYEANAQFHTYLLKHCGNPLLHQIWEKFRLSPPRPRTVESERQIMQNLPAELRDRPWLEEIVDAISAHDQNRAEAVVKTQVRAVTEALRKSVWNNGSV